MKKTVLLTLSFVLSFSLIASNMSNMSNETDSLSNDSAQSTIITDGSSYNAIFLWKKKKNRKYDPHWDGIGFSFLSIANENDIPGLDLMASKSYSITINPVEYYLPIGRSNWMLVSGLGIDWSRYHFRGNHGLGIADGTAQFIPAPEGIQYSSSKLLAYYFTLPLLVEFQTNLNTPSRSTFFVSAGVVGYLKCYSKSQVAFDRKREDLGRDLNLHPFGLRYMVQAGVNGFSLVATYSPFSMFRSGKGPDMRTMSLGVSLSF